MSNNEASKSDSITASEISNTDLPVCESSENTTLISDTVNLDGNDSVGDSGQSKIEVPTTKPRLPRPFEGQGEGNTSKTEDNNAIVSSTEGEVTLGLRTRPIVTLSGIREHDTNNQLEFGDDDDDIESMELMNFGDEPDLGSIKDELFGDPTANTDLSIDDVNALDSVFASNDPSLTRVDKDAGNISHSVPESNANEVQNLDSELDDADEQRPTGKPLNALSLLAMNYDNDDGDLELPSPTLSDDINVAKPLSVNETCVVNVNPAAIDSNVECVEPDSTTTVITPLPENTAPTDFLDIDALPDTLNDLEIENSNDLPLEELGLTVQPNIDDSTSLDAVLNPMLELPTDPSNVIVPANTSSSANPSIHDEIGKCHSANSSPLASCLSVTLDTNKIVVLPPELIDKEIAETENEPQPQITEQTDAEVKVQSEEFSLSENAPDECVDKSDNLPQVEDISLRGDDEVEGQVIEKETVSSTEEVIKGQIDSEESVQRTLMEQVTSSEELNEAPLKEVDKSQPVQESTVGESVSSTEDVKVGVEGQPESKVALPSKDSDVEAVSKKEDVKVEEDVPEVPVPEPISSTSTVQGSQQPLNQTEPENEEAEPLTEKPEVTLKDELKVQPLPEKSSLLEAALQDKFKVQERFEKPTPQETTTTSIRKDVVQTPPEPDSSLTSEDQQQRPETLTPKPDSSACSNELTVQPPTSSDLEVKVQAQSVPPIRQKASMPIAPIIITRPQLPQGQGIQSEYQVQRVTDVKVQPEEVDEDETEKVPETLRETRSKLTEKLEKIITSPESQNKTQSTIPTKKSTPESHGVIPTIKITASGISVVPTKPTPSSTPNPTVKRTSSPKPYEDANVPKPSTESLTPTRIIIRPLPPFNPPQEILPVRSVKPLILKHSKDPIPRLVIKPVSATRPVASVETLPSRPSTDTSKNSASKTASTSNDNFSVPSIKIITKAGETHSIVKESSPKRPATSEVDGGQLLAKRSHLESALLKEAGFQVFDAKTSASSSKAEKFETTRTKPQINPIIITLDSPDVPSSPNVVDLEAEETAPNVAEPATKTTLEASTTESNDFDGDIYDANEVSLPASLCENDDFSFIKPKSADVTDDVIAPDGGTGKNGNVVAPFIEEDTQSSWSLDPKPPKIKEIETLTAKAIDEESRASIGSVGSKKSNDEASIIASQASGIFEYQWPLVKGEFYILQEHLSEFLGVKSFKRKHPDLPRRNVDNEERQFLREKNVVSETQCDLGLTALRSEDVMELMIKDYPEKYQEYVRAVQEKQRLELEKKTKEYAAATADKNKMKEILRKAIKSASEYNAHLNQERRDERKMSFDLQTYTIHVPASKKRKLDPELTKVGKYPVALIPGQFQDSYRKYTPNELKYLPLNSVLYGPLQELNTIHVPPSSDGSQSESDSDSDGSCCSNSSFGTQDSGDSSSGSDSNTGNTTVNNNNNNTKNGDVFFKPKDVQPSPCKICHGTQDQNKQQLPEELIQCSQCKTSAHPSCLELPSELVAVIKTYDWLCMDCKTCISCGDPNDEEKLMFCDKCDRGFHTFCVGLRDLPKGRWICQMCGKCAICGSKTPGPEGTKLQWQLAAGEGNKKPQLLCVACSKKKTK